jgi:hypothetical protein
MRADGRRTPGQSYVDLAVCACRMIRSCAT